MPDTNMRYMIALALFCARCFGQAQPGIEMFELAAVIPKSTLTKVLQETKAKRWYDDRYIVKKTADGISLGLFFFVNTSDELIFVDQNGIVGRVKGQISADANLKLGKGAQFRTLRGTDYYCGTTDIALEVKDSLRVVQNPWDPTRIKELYPGVPLNYAPADVGTLPLFRIRKREIISVSPTGSIDYYSADSSRLQLERRVAMKFKRTRPFLRDNISVYRLDPVLLADTTKILFWSGSFVEYYDLTSRKFLTIDYNDGVFSPQEIGLVTGDATAMGSSYYSDGEELYVFRATEKGIFVFRYKG
jgi:hypothetical protein